MNGVRDQFFACSSFTSDQDGKVRRRDFFNCGKDFL